MNKIRYDAIQRLIVAWANGEMSLMHKLYKALTVTEQRTFHAARRSIVRHTREYIEAECENLTIERDLVNMKAELELQP